MVQSPTFDQERQICASLSFKRNMAIENVLIKKLFLIKERALVSEFWELSDFFP
jgi:hypothetical protein